MRKVKRAWSSFVPAGNRFEHLQACSTFPENGFLVNVFPNIPYSLSYFIFERSFFMVFEFNNIFLDLDFIFFPSCYTLRVSEAASFRSSGFGYFEACPTFPRNGFLVNFVLFSFFLCFNAVFPPCYITKSFVPHICRLFFSSQTISLSKLKTFVCLVFLPSLV